MITKQHGPVIFIDDDEEVSGAQALELEGFEVIALDSLPSNTSQSPGQALSLAM